MLGALHCGGSSGASVAAAAQAAATQAVATEQLVCVVVT